MASGDEGGDVNSLADGDANMEESLHLVLMSYLLIFYHLLHLVELLLQISESGGGRTDNID